jgi:hypothetical protein
MKNLSLQKKSLFIATSALFFYSTGPALAWSGYDYDNKTDIEIEAGNLIREGLTFQFYDMKNDTYHTGKITFMEPVAGGTRIQLQELETKKERIFIMRD